MQNLELAQEALSNIKSQPELFSMDRWGRIIPSQRKLFRKAPATFTACIAGHTLLAAGYTLTGQDHFVQGREHVRIGDVAVTAKELLGLTQYEYEFRYSRHWHDECMLFCGFAQKAEAVRAFSMLVEVEAGRRRMVTVA